MSYEPKTEDIARLREQTQAGIMDCKRALKETEGDFEAARDLLRAQGLAGIQKRAARVAAEGGVFHYIHQIDPELPAKVGVLIELNCETDFVAKTPEFKELGRNLAMHIAAMEPAWVSSSDVPDDVIERERKIILESDAVKGKPDDVVSKIVDGKISSIYSEKGGALLAQKYVRDESGKQTVEGVIHDYAAKVKENVIVRRFARFRVGEES
ncbi:MAG: elongation factor Ts [Actinobacteria bacterium]|nr:elongation factor Ts [Actinomycetota bacterium]